MNKHQIIELARSHSDDLLQQIAYIKGIMIINALEQERLRKDQYEMFDALIEIKESVLVGCVL